MKLFAIRDGMAEREKDLAYLIYYENAKKFYIELPDGADPWETPLLLESFLAKGETSVNSYWSMVWVQQRIVPPDRQNIAQILRDNGLSSYDEFALLMLTAGRCVQDDYYLVPLDASSLPQEIVRRLNHRLEEVVPLENNCLLVFFRDGKIKKVDLNGYFAERKQFAVLVQRPEYFARAYVQTGGFGVQWDENLAVSYATMSKMGKTIPLTPADFKTFAATQIINANEAAELLNCSRQYINELVKTGKLHPLKASGKNTLFWKTEVMQKLWR